MVARLAGRPRVAVIRIAEAVARTVLFTARAACGFETEVPATDKRDRATGACAKEGNGKQRRQMRPHRETPVSINSLTGAPRTRSEWLQGLIRTKRRVPDCEAHQARPALKGR